MTDEALHPDHLQPGHRVGPWLIVQVLGRGGSSRVFKVERDGCFYSLKMALRPLTASLEGLSEEEDAEEKSVYRRLAREAAALFTYSSHPNLLRVYAVDFWPNPSTGYPFLVTDFIDGDTWHQRRWREPLDATGLVDAFSDVVRTVGVLHSRGVYHRDLKAENILIRREDGRPFLIDFGTVRLPGALTQTLGIPEGVLHLLPPELLAYTRSEAWKRGEPFQGGVAADLYALGVLLYQGLTDLHPFNPELPDKELLAAIATVPPTAPHLLNPRAPRSLSDIAMKLLEKRPEDRYPSTEVLLQALWSTGRERTSGAWKVPLFAVEERLEETPPQEAGGQPAPPPGEEERQAETRQGAPAAPVHPRRARWPLVLLASLTMAGLALWLVCSTLEPPAEAQLPGTDRSKKGSPAMSTPSRSTPSSLLAAWLCAVAGLGCPAAQVKPPSSEECPKEVIKAMQGLRVWRNNSIMMLVDINQPGYLSEVGVYQEGPVIGRVTEGTGDLPEETLLHGRLWTGPGVHEEDGSPAVMGRYTLAILPDGRKYPVCIALGDDGRVAWQEGSKPGAVLLGRDLPARAVHRWP